MKSQRVGACLGIGGVFMSSIAAIAACVGSDPGSDNSSSGGPDGAASSSGTTSSSGTSSSGASSSGGSSGATVCTDASDVSSDANNCGACGNKCATGFGCSDSRCDNLVDDVSAGAAFACALLHGGKVYCWGSMQDGRLGVEPSGSDADCGSNKCRATPGAVPGITTAVKLSVGDDHACVVKKNGSVACWGKNDLCQLATSNATSHSATPLDVGLPVGTIVTDVSTQESATCVRTSAGEIYCWGANEGGQVGRTISTTGEPIPNKVITAGATAVRIGANYGDHGHACALVGNNVYCWGSTLNGEGGGGYTDESPTPRIVYTGNSMPVFTGVKDLAVSAGQSCLLKSTGNVFCMGSNFFAVFPPKSSTAGNNYPAEVTGLPLDGASIFMWSYGPVYLLTAGGDVWGWSIVDDGALGNGVQTGDACGTGTSTCAATVSKITNLSGTKRIAPSQFYGIALRTNGEVVGWGANRYANLGHMPGTGPDTDCTAGDKCTLTPTVIAGLP